MRSRLGEPLSSLLLEARELEEAATGADRLRAYRTSRILIGALLEAGFSATAIASCLGITNGSVRNRAEPDGVLLWSTIRSLTERADAQLLVPMVPLTPSHPGERAYRALELVRALDPQLSGPADDASTGFATSG
ncbi:MAG: hypothetical protein ACHP7F_00835 [Actinomycetales bacterium]